MKWDKSFVFSDVAVYSENGDYIVHNTKLNSWVVYGKEEYNLAAEIIYSNLTPNQLVELGYDKSLVRKVASKFLLYSIGYQGERPKEYDVVESLYTQGMGKVVPNSVYFVTTYKCNLNCVYCYADSSPDRTMNGDLSTEEAINMIEQIKSLGARTIIFTGGEAFLRKDILQLMEYSKKIGLRVNVITNGTFINSKEKAEKIAELCNLVTISLDSMEKSEHEANRGIGTWEKALGAINLLYEAGCKVKINQTITKNNPNALNGLIKFTKERAMRLNITAIAQLGRGDNTIQGLSYSERRRLSDKILEDEMREIDHEDCQALDVRQFEHKRHCGHGTSEFSIDAKGNVFPCKLMHHPMFYAGSIREKSLREIWESSLVFERSRERTVHTLPGCSICTFRESCGGGCRAFHWGGSGDANGTWDIECSGIRRGIRRKMWASFRLVKGGQNQNETRVPIGT